MARILMYSGGLDSFILKRIYGFHDEECMFVNIGTNENFMEEGIIRREFPDMNITHLPLFQWELENKIIPFRNSFLALVGAQSAEEIYFGFTIGDTTRDKDSVFKAQMEGMLNYFGADERKIGISLKEAYSIQMPFKYVSKSNIVAAYLRAGFPYEDLFSKSVSCYEGSQFPCGECRSCIRKYVAVRMGVLKLGTAPPETPLRDFFSNDPKEGLRDFYEESLQKGRKAEIMDIKRCLEL